MADSDFRVKAIIEANTSSFDKGMKQAQASATNLSNTFGNLSKIITKALSFAGLAVGTKAIVDFGKSCVQSANQAIKAFNILDNTINATGADAWTSTKELDSMAKTLSSSTNYSVTEIENMQSVLLGFTNITGESFEEASNAVLDMATVMGMDLTSAVQTVGKALDDPISGLDSLRRQGFKFTDEQKAELAQLVKNGKRLEAQKIILDSLSMSYGGASRAGQDSFAKQRHAIENFRDTLGGKLIPVVKVFAEDNAKMINSLRELVEKTDFTPVVNIVTNLKKVISETFDKISEYVNKVGAEVQDFVSRFNFKPLISILDTLIGLISGVINKFNEINSQKLNVFEQIKESVISLSNSDAFQNIVDFVNKVIDGAFFLWSEIQDITMEIRQMIVDKVIEIWNKVKEFFQNTQDALANSGQDIASWGNFFWSILDNVFKIFQDLVNSIKAILHGDWAVAWEYAKLTVMRVADSILDLISTIANAFPNLINGMIEELNKLITEVNKVRGWFGKDPLGLVQAFESVDLSKSTGLEKKIQETENKIQELTGHTADIAIKDLQGVSTQFAGFTSSALGFIQDLTDGVEVETKKQKKYFSGVASSAESSYEKFSEWDSKLLQQRLEDLSEWSDEAHEINLQLIEEERKKALEADKTGAETEKINKYYNEKIKKENERAEQAKRNMIKETALIAINQLKTIASNTYAVFNKVVSTIKNLFSSAVSIFGKIFEINPDEILDNILKVEDNILTFFVETLPKMPSLISSIMQSVSVLVGNIKNIVKAKDIRNLISSILNSITSNLPQIVGDILAIAKELLSGVIQGLSQWVKSGGWSVILDLLLTIQTTIEEIVTENLDDIINVIIDALPALVETLKKSIVSASKTLGEIAKSLLPLIAEVIIAIIDVITSDEVIEASIEAIEGIIEGLIPAIVKILVNALPKIINFFLIKLPMYTPKLVKGVINGLVKGFKNVNWGETALSIFTGFFDALSDIFKNGFADAVKDGIQEMLSGFKKLLNKIKEVINAYKELAEENVGLRIGADILTGGLAELFMFERGTNNAPSGLALVGEAGPELVRFRGGEQVLNNHNTNKALSQMGGNTINQSITFNNLKDTSAFAMMQQLKTYNRQMAINGIL